MPAVVAAASAAIVAGPVVAEVEGAADRAPVMAVRDRLAVAVDARSLRPTPALALRAEAEAVAVVVVPAGRVPVAAMQGRDATAAAPAARARARPSVEPG